MIVTRPLYVLGCDRCEWDGHTTPEKYRRLDAVTSTLAELRRLADTKETP